MITDPPVCVFFSDPLPPLFPGLPARAPRRGTASANDGCTMPRPIPAGRLDFAICDLCARRANRPRPLRSGGMRGGGARDALGRARAVKAVPQRGRARGAIGSAHRVKFGPPLIAPQTAASTRGKALSAEEIKYLAPQEIRMACQWCGRQER